MRDEEGRPPRTHRPPLNKMLKNTLSLRLLKKVQMQGGTPKPERGVLEVRRSEWRGGPTLQMGLFQQPAPVPAWDRMNPSTSVRPAKAPLPPGRPTVNAPHAFAQVAHVSNGHPFR